MDINQIKELIKAVSESDIASIDINDVGESGLAITIKKASAYMGNPQTKMVYEVADMSQETIPVTADQAQPASVSTESDTQPAQDEAAELPQGSVIKCPLVGTVYVAPEPGAEPFVKVGDHVKRGQTLAIVEAMKLMNTIESEVDGTVAAILIEDGMPISYDQEMFVIS